MKTSILFIFLVPLALSAQIGAKVQQQGKIFGLWQNSQFGYQMTLMLNENGTGEFDGETIKFTTTANKLSISQAGQTTAYTYSQQGNSLTLSGGDLDAAITFARAGGADPIPAIVSTPSTKQPAGGDANAGLVGVWSGNGETIEFKSNGQCVYIGNTYPYEASQGHVTLTTSQGKVMFAYAITGDQLKLTANGKEFSYNRGAGDNTSGGASDSGEAGYIAPELVGQWCYMSNSLNSSTNNCITLNADGTYIYNGESSRTVSTPDLYGGTSSQGSDRGTWYLRGDRIYYNSQTKGPGSYRLEKRNHPKNVGDPMIVLDGEAYVTATLKQPWR
jgi:hypothetical protein